MIIGRPAFGADEANVRGTNAASDRRYSSQARVRPVTALAREEYVMRPELSA